MPDISTQFRTEGEPAFPVLDPENENSAASSAGQETTIDPTRSSEGEKNSADANKEGDNKDTNFADNPRWQERESDWKNRFAEQEKRHLEAIEKLRTEFAKGKSDAEATPEKVPSWFGGDQKAWNEFLAWNEQLVAKATEEVRHGLEEKSAADQKRIDEATAYFQQEVGAIESDKTLNPNGEKIDRNKLLKTALDNDLVDSQGRWNYRAAFRLMRAGLAEANRKTIEEKKRVAGASTSDNRGETPPKDFMTSEDFKQPGARPW